MKRNRPKFHPVSDVFEVNIRDLISVSSSKSDDADLGKVSMVPGVAENPQSSFLGPLRSKLTIDQFNYLLISYKDYPDIVRDLKSDSYLKHP